MDQYCEHSIREECKSNRGIIQRIFDHAMQYRPASFVTYTPFTFHPQVNIIHDPGIDLASLFGNYEVGDHAVISCFMDGLYDYDLILNIRYCGKCTAYFNGKQVNLIARDDGSFDANVSFQKGKNALYLHITAGTNGFYGYVKPLLPHLRMFPAGYVYYTRMYTEADGFYKQNGIAVSRLYHKDELFPTTPQEIEWSFPAKPLQSSTKEFCFDTLCNNRGKAAYVHTYVQGLLSVRHTSPLRIFSRSKLLYSSSCGTFERRFETSTHLLIKSVRGTNSWGFSAVVDGRTALPFVEGADCADLQWIWIGPFGRESDADDYPYSPEKHLQFEEPYQSICAGPIYWKFYRPNTYLRQYVSSAFFGQWFYASMVGHYGMKLAAERLGISEFREYYMNSIGQMCRHRNYSVFDRGITGWASYMPSSAVLNNLDAIGTIGINVAEYYLMSGDLYAKNMLQLLADNLMHNIPRFPDGTFHRKATMWTDDMYMCLPFLARLWALSADEAFLREIVTQVTGFYSRMFMADQNLFSHIFFITEGCINQIPWCRGNGWVLLALSEVLQIMPEAFDGYQTVLQIYRQLAQGILHFRDKGNGIWHQVINNEKSYIETSGSAMFITALARGVKNGWLNDKYKDDVLDAWNSLTTCCVDLNGNIYGICMGSGCSMDEKYYLDLGTISNDDHGVGIVLGAGVAVMELLDE